MLAGSVLVVIWNCSTAESTFVSKRRQLQYAMAKRASSRMNGIYRNVRSRRQQMRRCLLHKFVPGIPFTTAVEPRSLKQLLITGNTILSCLEYRNENISRGYKFYFYCVSHIAGTVKESFAICFLYIYYRTHEWCNTCKQQYPNCNLCFFPLLFFFVYKSWIRFIQDLRLVICR